MMLDMRHFHKNEIYLKYNKEYHDIKIINDSFGWNSTIVNKCKFSKPLDLKIWLKKYHCTKSQ